LIDLKADPVDGTPLGDGVPGLIERCRALAPRAIILVKATVYDAAYTPMKWAGQPVIEERIPFPGSGQQRRFEQAFARVLQGAYGRRDGNPAVGRRGPRHPILPSLRADGWHQPAGRADGTVMGRVGRAPEVTVRPTGRCREGSWQKETESW
jgi:hypothetical protein